MASGRSLELREIKPPEPDPVCVCGAPFSDHFEQLEGNLTPTFKEKYNDGSRHYQAGTIAGGTLRR